jgi:hypothetical protein
LQQKYASKVIAKVSDFNNHLQSATKKNLDDLIVREKKMQQMVARVDSLKAKNLFKYSIDSLRRFKAMMTSKTGKLTRLFKGNYFAYLDTLKGSLSFLKRMDSVTSQAAAFQSKLGASLSSVDQMESRLNTVNQINTYLQQRQLVLQAQLKQLPMLADPLQRFSRQAATYEARISAYKAMLADPDRIEKLVLNRLEQTTSFQHFFQQNSQLTGTFASPPNLTTVAGVLGSMPVINGIPNRAMLQNFTNKEMPALANVDPVQVIQQKTQPAGGAGPAPGTLPPLASLVSRVPLSGRLGNGGNSNLPSNHQSALSFARRLEYGLNLQFTGGTNYLPSAANVGVQIGYKLNDKSNVGIGASYALGMGSGWNHIKFTNNAVGLRQFLTYKTGKSFFLQGGAEFNYMTAFSSIQELRNLNAWQTSALLGIGREYRIGKKMKGNILLLYDLLYSSHHPPTQPLIFRFGYNL